MLTAEDETFLLSLLGKNKKNTKISNKQDKTSSSSKNILPNKHLPWYVEYQDKNYRLLHEIGNRGNRVFCKAVPDLGKVIVREKIVKGSNTKEPITAYEVIIYRGIDSLISQTVPRHMLSKEFERLLEKLNIQASLRQLGA